MILLNNEREKNMTNIPQHALEAAVKAMDENMPSPDDMPDYEASFWHSGYDTPVFVEVVRKIIQAYEKALWRPVEEMPKDGQFLLFSKEGFGFPNNNIEIGTYDNWNEDIDYFRPLPQFQGE